MTRPTPCGEQPTSGGNVVALNPARRGCQGLHQKEANQC